VHGWESWDKLPSERQRLFDLLEATGASNTVFVSGDRHTAFLYKKEIEGVGDVREITASSVNSVFANDPVSEEVDADQIDKGYTFENYGLIDIDWDKKEVVLSIRGQDGSSKIAHSFGF
jgi:alkaline phosphatase D